MHARMLRDVGLTRESFLELADALDYAAKLLVDLEGTRRHTTELPVAILQLQSAMNENLSLLVRQAAETTNETLQLYSNRSIDNGNVVQLQRVRTTAEHAQYISTFVAQCFDLVKSIERYVASQRALDPL